MHFLSSYLFLSCFQWWFLVVNQNYFIVIICLHLDIFPVDSCLPPWPPPTAPSSYSSFATWYTSTTTLSMSPASTSAVCLHVFVLWSSTSSTSLSASATTSNVAEVELLLRIVFCDWYSHLLKKYPTVFGLLHWYQPLSVCLHFLYFLFLYLQFLFLLSFVITWVSGWFPPSYLSSPFGFNLCNGTPSICQSAAFLSNISGRKQTTVHLKCVNHASPYGHDKDNWPCFCCSCIQSVTFHTHPRISIFYCIGFNISQQEWDQIFISALNYFLWAVWNSIENHPALTKFQKEVLEW